MDRRENKPLLVEACRDLLPAAVTNRKKMGFTLPYEEWLRGPLRSTVEEALLDPSYGGPIAEMLDHDVIARTWQRFLNREAVWTRPWALYAVKHWGARLEQHALAV
jgi:asparagine synthase (glutamine-hydrolysing)